MPSPAFRHGIAPCPGCQAELVAPFQAAGRAVKCKSCGTRFALPDAEELFESAVAFLIDYETQREEHDEVESVAPQIQQDTMVREEEAVQSDPAWLG